MKYSISNLAWGKTPLDQVIPKLASVGLQGVEIAPTAIWPNLDNLRDQEVIEFKKYLEGHNLVVSGIQSLLYGHPELQLFNQNCWGDLKNHLEKVIRIGGLLEADVAVFGSPKNRLKGTLDLTQANEMAKTFFLQIDPCLKDNDIVLTLEPNATEYGADYLTTYEQVINLSRTIESKSIKPQIDTGCLWMAGTSPEIAFALYQPHHIHLSVPFLERVPGTYAFEEFIRLVSASEYSGWFVIEMLGKTTEPIKQAIDSINWLTTLRGKFLSAKN